MPEDLKMITAAVSAAIAIISLIISLRTHFRSITAERLQLFLEFRARFISDQLERDIAEVAQLLLKSKDHTLATSPYSPAVGRVLNHLEWVGYFDKKGFVDQEHIWSTFGSEVLDLYPGLFCYICNQRKERKLPDLWCHVDLLYERLWCYAKEHDLLGDHELPSTLKMRSFLPDHKRPPADIKHHLERLVKKKPGDPPNES
jgi:hypothetical protein